MKIVPRDFRRRTKHCLWNLNGDINIEEWGDNCVNHVAANNIDAAWFHKIKDVIFCVTETQIIGDLSKCCQRLNFHQKHIFRFKGVEEGSQLRAQPIVQRTKFFVFGPRFFQQSFKLTKKNEKRFL